MLTAIIRPNAVPVQCLCRRRARAALRRVAHSAFTAAVALLVVTSAVSAPQTEPLDQRPLPPESESAVSRIREGTQIVDRLGTFTVTANQAVFLSSDGKLELGGLPNLNLERIIRTLQDSEDGLVWSLSGLVTEYHGSNYLLITRAVLKSKRSTRASRLEQPGTEGAKRRPSTPPTRGTQLPPPGSRRSAHWLPRSPRHDHQTPDSSRRPA